MLDLDAGIHLDEVEAAILRAASGGVAGWNTRAPPDSLRSRARPPAPEIRCGAGSRRTSPCRGRRCQRPSTLPIAPVDRGLASRLRRERSAYLVRRRRRTL